MNARNPSAGWFTAEGAEDVEGAATAIRDGRADEPRDWPELAISSGFVDDETEYYERLRKGTLQAARDAVTEREGADDQQLMHAIRALDDCARTANELTERVAEWAGTHDPDVAVNMATVREFADKDPEDPLEGRIVSLAERVVELDEERAQLRAHIERTAPGVAPNLSSLAGPVLAARLIALAGGLESLAKKPAGTVQVLGAEEALFAHLRGNASPPKHGVIYTHEAVRGMPPDERGSAARALAGKLAIAARIDHYSGDIRPELAADLEERIETIRQRGPS